MIVKSVGEKKMRWLPAIVALALALPALSLGTGSSYAQAGSRTFPETGKTVKGAFLAYWDSHGGLAQQGFPISEEMPEVSETDGKSYTVQYFERAVFELHTELPAPNNVLLSLLGNFLYKQKYPSGAPNQQPNADLNFQIFQETGKRVGGKFLDYWKSHGGLAQQGFPISEEFVEVSSLNGLPYKVQYFERAVFEFHPENQPPFDVLLSQLGKFRYDAKYGKGGPQPTAVGQPTAQPQPLPTQPPTNDPCAGIPPSEKASVSPVCARRGTNFRITGQGFLPGEMVAAYTTFPDGSVDNMGYQVQANSQGSISYTYETSPDERLTGLWVETLEGTSSKRRAFARFKVLP